MLSAGALFGWEKRKKKSSAASRLNFGSRNESFSRIMVVEEDRGGLYSDQNLYPKKISVPYKGMLAKKTG